MCSAGTDSGQASPITRPIDTKTPDFNLPQIPHFNDSPHSSAPTTPTDEHALRSGHRKTDSVNIEGEEYFLSLANFTSSDSKSLPGTPRSLASRNITFSPRIQFHDTWPPGEYDRRGEIATCNRLTPLLAQQIKEELNTFKMVCIFGLVIIYTRLLHTRKWKCTQNLKSIHTSSDESIAPGSIFMHAIRILEARMYSRRLRANPNLSYSDQGDFPTR